MENIFDLSFQQNDLDGKLIVALNKLAQVLRLLLWETSNRLRLSPLQIQLLLHIHTHGDDEARVTWLARHFNLTKATVSDALSALERRGLIERQVVEKDRRAACIRLTEEARALIEEMSTWPLPLKQILGELDTGLKNQTLLFFLELISALEKAGLVHPTRMCLTCRFYRPAANAGGKPFCTLLNRNLNTSELRLDCPEHQRVVEPVSAE